MNRSKIKALVKQSYKNDDLNEEIIENIAQKLKRSELKQYIREIKIMEKKKNVIVTLAYLPTTEEQKKFQSLFPKRKIIYIIDPSLLVGLKVENNDLISEINLKENFQELVNYVTQNYD